MDINVDKITSITGITAAVCAGLVASGLLVPATVAYGAVVGIGTISGSIWAYFTNKESPFKKP